MRFTQFFLAVAAVTVTLASCDSKKSSVSLKNDADSISYCIGINVGQGIAQTEISNFNMAIFEQAIKDMLAKKEPKMKPEEINMFMQTYFSKLQMKVSEKNMKEGQEFLKKNKERSGVKTTASGLQYEVIKEGTGVVPKASDMVSVHYKGTLVDGTVFDSSYDRGQPISFAVTGVIPGWTEMLQLMKVGSKYKAYIPSELGYGANPNPRSKIKPNSVLIFEMELLSIEKPKPEVKK